MKTKDYQELEIIFDTAPKHKSNKHNFSSWLVHVCKSLAKALIGTNELQIWQKTDSPGDIYWKIYDPVTGRTNYFCSEAEVRIWLEQCCYRPFK